VAGFARIFRALKDAFPPSGLELHKPDQLTELVSLVKMIDSPLVRHEESLSRSIISAAGVGVIAGDTVPPARIHYIPFWQGDHTDPVARVVRLIAQHPSGVEVLVARSAVAAVSSSLSAVWIERGLLLPSGFTPLVRTDAIGAAAQVQIIYDFVEFTLSDFPPAL